MSRKGENIDTLPREALLRSIEQEHCNDKWQKGKLDDYFGKGKARNSLSTHSTIYI